MTTTTALQSITFTALPAIGADLDGGEFAGIVTKPDGKNYAVAKLPGHGSNLSHSQALAYAAENGGELPTKAVAALVVANLKIDRGWYWSQDEYDASYAWHFTSNGNALNDRKSYQGGALAVRCIQLTA